MRKKKNLRRDIKPDMRYDDIAVSRFINYLMQDGKKSVAERVFYAAMDIIEERTKENPHEVFEKAMSNVAPKLEVVSRRVGGANYQVPREVRGDRKFTLATRWIIGAARSQRGKAMAVRLADELMAASNNEGVAIKKRNDTHRMAEANRAFAHFAW